MVALWSVTTLKQIGQNVRFWCIFPDKGNIMVDVYQGNTLRINLAFNNCDGTPLNLSGYGIYYIAKQNYSQSTGDATINIYQTGYIDAAAGTTYIDLTTGDTSKCPGEYFADITLVSSGTPPQILTYRTDGLRILPNTFYSP